MKKLLIALLLIALLIPAMGAAAPSPSHEAKIKCKPAMPFDLLDDQLPELGIEGYTTIEVLSLAVDKEYELVEWTLLFPIELEDNIQVVLSHDEPVFLPVEVTEAGTIMADFTDIAPGTYLMYFLLGDA